MRVDIILYRKPCDSFAVQMWSTGVSKRNKERQTEKTYKNAFQILWVLTLLCYARSVFSGR
jgi:hypothetical protein